MARKHMIFEDSYEWNLMYEYKDDQLVRNGDRRLLLD